VGAGEGVGGGVGAAVGAGEGVGGGVGAGDGVGGDVGAGEGVGGGVAAPVQVRVAVSRISNGADGVPKLKQAVVETARSARQADTVSVPAPPDPV
jgi:hypothetical protein